MGDNAYNVELLSDMNISTNFNVVDLTPHIEDEDENIGYLRAIPLQGWEVDAKQTMRPNILINIKSWIQLRPLITNEGRTQVIGYLKFLLVCEP